MLATDGAVRPLLSNSKYLVGQTEGVLAQVEVGGQIQITVNKTER